MADSNQFFEDILNELSYRSKEGYPNLSKPEHITLLSEIPTDWGLSDVKFELIKNHAYLVVMIIKYYLLLLDQNLESSKKLVNL